MNNKINNKMSNNKIIKMSGNKMNSLRTYNNKSMINNLMSPTNSKIPMYHKM